MGRSSHDWLESIHHFSFAGYYNPDNMRFGALRVLNDDEVQPHRGFDTHSHKNMEILSYVIDGELTHADSMKNEETLTRGQVQYMSAGSGVYHSEYNLGDSPLRFLQIWILPNRNVCEPAYGSRKFTLEERRDRWMHIASGMDKSAAPIRVYADINVYATIIAPNTPLDFEINADRQAYLVVIEGACDINGIPVYERDALEIVEENIILKTRDTCDSSHILIIEMAKGS
jgi:redox-sensitive bicupin YhaK (pirin superfamily)